MNTCRDLNIKLCPNCKDNKPHCWIYYFVRDEKEYPSPSKSIIKCYFNLLKVKYLNSGYWYREALKQTNPNLVEEIDRLTILY